MTMLLAALLAAAPPAATVATPVSPLPAARAGAGGISVAGGATPTVTPTRTVPSAATATPAVTTPPSAYAPPATVARPAPTTAAAPRPASPATTPRPIYGPIPATTAGAVRPTTTTIAPRPAPAPRPAAPQAAQVLAAVRSEFPRYDTRGAGRLSPLEFSTWVLHANGVAVAPAGQPDPHGVKPVDAMNATARAFAAADANHDGGVTADEMAAFLTRRPAATAAR